MSNNYSFISLAKCVTVLLPVLALAATVLGRYLQKTSNEFIKCMVLVEHVTLYKNYLNKLVLKYFDSDIQMNSLKP